MEAAKQDENDEVGEEKEERGREEEENECECIHSVIMLDPSPKEIGRGREKQSKMQGREKGEAAELAAAKEENEEDDNEADEAQKEESHGGKESHRHREGKNKAP